MVKSKLARAVFLAAYYGVARKMGRSNAPFSCGARRIRQFLCRRLFKHMGSNVNIESLAHFGWGNEMCIGDNSGLGVNCRCVGSITIGDYVMMGPDVVVLTEAHEAADVTKPMGEQGYLPRRPVVIEDDVWLGTRVIVLPGLYDTQGGDNRGRSRSHQRRPAVRCDGRRSCEGPQVPH